MVEYITAKEIKSKNKIRNFITNSINLYYKEKNEIGREYIKENASFLTAILTFLMVVIIPLLIITIIGYLKLLSSIPIVAGSLSLIIFGSLSLFYILGLFLGLFLGSVILHNLIKLVGGTNNYKENTKLWLSTLTPVVLMLYTIDFVYYYFSFISILIEILAGLLLLFTIIIGIMVTTRTFSKVVEISYLKSLLAVIFPFILGLILTSHILVVYIIGNIITEAFFGTPIF